MLNAKTASTGNNDFAIGIADDCDHLVPKSIDYQLPAKLALLNVCYNSGNAPGLKRSQITAFTLINKNNCLTL